MGIVTRFAPSPTGQLHPGHGYSALMAHDFARARKGRFLLRIEDIDRGRCRAEHVATILADLKWLGIEWDGPVVVQSQRMATYSAALDRLKAMGVVYPCFCTRADIAREIAGSQSAPHGPDGPLYPGICRHVSDGERAERVSREDHAWRIDMARAAAMAAPLEWRDERMGTIAADPLSLGDVVLARKDAGTSYHLAVTIDDAAQGVTDVVRGVDLFHATHVHRLLQTLLGLPTPIYHHHALLTDGDGKRLAKRDGAPTLAAMREGGEDGLAVAERLRNGKFSTLTQPRSC